MSTCAIAPVFVHSSVKRRKSSWYAQASGNWSDPTIWESNALKRWSYPGQNIAAPIFPQIGDDVYIGAGFTVTLNVGTVANPIVINNIYVAGTFKSDTSGRVLIIWGDLQATGTVDFTGNNLSITLRGINNFIASFPSAGNTFITYSGIGDQNIIDIIYQSVYLRYVDLSQRVAVKYAVNNVTILGTLYIDIPAKLELGIYNLSITGATAIGNSLPAGISKTGSGSLLFIGALSYSAGGVFSLAGNANVEFRGGFTGSINTFISGTGTYSFTTNSQNWSASGVYNGPVLIVGSITVTIPAGTITIASGNSIDGTVAGSALILKGTLNLLTSILPMATNGSFDYLTNSSSIIQHYIVGNYTFPWTTYNSLQYAGGGTKTLAGNTTINVNFVNNGATLDIAGFNLTVLGTTAFSATVNSGTGGTLTFTGLLQYYNGTVNLSTANPNVEFKGGLQNLTAGIWIAGSGTYTFSTNNQTLTSVSTTFSGSVIISGAITLTQAATALGITFTGTLNGNNAASTFDNRGIIAYQNTTRPMVTGILSCNNAANTFKYNKAGAQDVTGGTYRTIEFGGSGVKTLQGNVIVNVSAGGGQSTTGTASINLNGFTITTI